MTEETYRGVDSPQTAPRPAANPVAAEGGVVRRELLLRGTAAVAVMGAAPFVVAPLDAAAAEPQAPLIDPWKAFASFDRKTFTAFLDLVIESTESELETAKGTAAALLRALLQDLKLARETLRTPGDLTLDLAKTATCIALSKQQALQLGASLVSTAFHNPISRIGGAIAAIKVVIAVLKQTAKDEKKAAALDKLVDDLVKLQSQAAGATGDELNKIKKRIQDKLEDVQKALKDP